MKYKDTCFKDKNIPLSALVSIIHRQYIIYLNYALEESGIRANQVPLLLYLLKNEESCQDEIANKFLLDKGSVARSIKKLEDDKYINREIDENNRRKYKLSLTKKGKKTALDIKKIDKKWEILMSDHMMINPDIIYERMREIATVSVDITSELKLQKGE